MGLAPALGKGVGSLLRGRFVLRCHGSLDAVLQLVPNGLDGIEACVEGRHTVVHALKLLLDVVKFGLANGFLELPLELRRHAAKLSRHLPDRSQGLRQILGADDDQRDGADHHHLTPAHVQHGVALTLPLLASHTGSHASRWARNQTQPTL